MHVQPDTSLAYSKESSICVSARLSHDISNDVETSCIRITEACNSISAHLRHNKSHEIDHVVI